MRAARIIAALSILALTACSNGGTPTAAPATPSPVTKSSAPAAAEEYDGAQRLVGALNGAGIECLNWERTEDPIGAVERGSCYVGTEEVVASIYADHAEAEAQPDSKAQMLAGISDVDMVVGGNWTLSCDRQDLCAQIARDFGGKHIHIPA
jgi:hypothetical protein